MAECKDKKYISTHILTILDGQTLVGMHSAANSCCQVLSRLLGHGKKSAVTGITSLVVVVFCPARVHPSTIKNYKAWSWASDVSRWNKRCKRLKTSRTMHAQHCVRVLLLVFRLSRSFFHFNTSITMSLNFYENQSPIIWSAISWWNQLRRNSTDSLEVPVFLLVH